MYVYIYNRLVDKLPKVSQQEEEDEVLGADALQARAISSALKSWTKRAYDPTIRSRKQSSQIPWAVRTNVLTLPYGPKASPAAREYVSSLIKNNPQKT